MWFGGIICFISKCIYLSGSLHLDHDMKNEDRVGDSDIRPSLSILKEKPSTELEAAPNIQENLVCSPAYKTQVPNSTMSI